jgi:hypothetical protein
MNRIIVNTKVAYKTIKQEKIQNKSQERVYPPKVIIKTPLNSVHINQLIVKMKHKTKLAKLILIYQRYNSPLVNITHLIKILYVIHRVQGSRTLILSFILKVKL